MREILERIEELLSLQEKLVNLLFLSGSQRIRLNVNTAFDLLYHNIELLDLIEELISTQEELLEEQTKEYTLNLILEALSWMGLIFPAIEDSCPIFLQGFSKEDPIPRISFILKKVEDYHQSKDIHHILRVAEELNALSNFLKYQLLLARRSYMNLA
ncbi:MAG: hypothetical protein ACK4MW_03180 [Aquificaceae bacterium]